MLTIDGLAVRYGRLEALHHVSLSIGEGSFVAVLGRNGAGKSTLVHTVAGLLDPAAGVITFNRECLNGASPSHIVRRGIAVVPEGRQLFTDLSVRDNLRLGAFGSSTGGFWRWAQTLLPTGRRIDRRVGEVVDLLPELAALLDRHAWQLSGGEQQMVAVGRALMADPSLLIVDELSLGLAPLVVRRLAEHLRWLNTSGVAVLLIEQNIQLALELATHAYILDTGQVRFGGAASEVISQRNVLATYLDLPEDAVL